ncbi:NAD-dependent epimerase/dehydratase family protein [Streptomyces kaniharaensis]|uniref:NAD-dependent epimerase/dehydratase family protein n=1 Tax=Streptomyces kaniharaensis TaxID=212423 RepID=A0A6N7KI48_9ACTN|nr:NAD-dependent epimerase/dehydratase family protein [Streptomyces kaniharaensis]MQS11160.1 NAD-dependent epimerase/dehydratase family protein [Streptomyces kaniharaensis]
MRLLLLGGTKFVGRAVAEEAVARGWEVTALNRGTQPAPEGVTVLRGDRTAEGGLAALATGEWDAVVDTWSWAPAAVRDSARLLRDRVGHYAYVSSCSVYAYPKAPAADESARVVEGSPDAVGEVPYAEAKRGAELALEAEFGGRALLARAGLIIGPYENIGRLPWWLSRIARGGPVLAPGPRDLPLQYVDARDLARWMLDATTARLGGAYNVVSPAGHATTESLLEACVRATGSDAELCWTDPERIVAAGVEPWTELPIWVAPGELYDYLHNTSVARAVADGLRCRPVTETVEDTWAWLRSIGGSAPQRADRPNVGLDPEREAELLKGLQGLQGLPG